MNESTKNETKATLDELLTLAAKDLLREEVDFARSLDTAEAAVSEKAVRRVRRTIKTHERSSWWSELPLGLRRSVAAVLVACTVSFALCLSIDAVRKEIANTIVKWYEEFIAVFYVADDTPPSFIEVYMEPTLAIVGTEREVVSRDETNYVIKYVNEDNVVLVYSQNVFATFSFDFNSEYACEQIPTEINGYAATMFIYKNGFSAITWNDNDYAFVIQSFTAEIDTNILTNIAESVK